MSEEGAKRFDVEVAVEDKKATMTLEGKLTVQTSPELSDAVSRLPHDVCDIDVELSKVSYIASAGLRVLVAMAKLAATRGGTLRLLHPCDSVYDVFEMTSLSSVFAIER